MNIVVIDAQGGGIGKQLISQIKNAFPNEKITAIGTNSIATSSMLKAGADQGATGENSVLIACRDADVIVGPIGIIIPDAMIGEITPTIAQCVARSRATRILIPFNNCSTYIAGTADLTTKDLIQFAVDKLRELLNE